MVALRRPAAQVPPPLGRGLNLTFSAVFAMDGGAAAAGSGGRGLKLTFSTLFATDGGDEEKG